jgi:hypothetical protein
MTGETLMKRTYGFSGGAVRSLPALAVLLALAAASCGLYTYGQLGGADLTGTCWPGDPEFEERMAFLSGVWYSHYAGIGRLDGYRAGKWGYGDRDFRGLIQNSGKIGLFPEFDAGPGGYDTVTGATARLNGDWFMFYDDTVYGETDEGGGGNGGFEDVIGGRSRYIGIVRAINIFNGDRDRGAIIIEYLKGCTPTWGGLGDERHPFFGIYYRVLGPDVVQMANAVDLAALYDGRPYFTETATLDEAIAANTVENEAEFISWGVVIPQDRER